MSPRSSGTTAAAAAPAAAEPWRRLERTVLGPGFRLAGAGAGAAFVVTGAAYLRLSVDTADFWQHMAAIRTLAGDLWQPGPLLISAPYQAYLYTPCHLAWATLMAIGGLSVWQVATLAGTVSLVLLGLGLLVL